MNETPNYIIPNDVLWEIGTRKGERAVQTCSEIGVMGVPRKREGVKQCVFISVYSYYILMPTKTVSLSEDAYELLSREKRPGESFSDVVRRLTSKKHPLSYFAGAWKNMPAEKRQMIEDAIGTGRKKANEKTKKKLKKMLR